MREREKKILFYYYILVVSVCFATLTQIHKERELWIIVGNARTGKDECKEEDAGGRMKRFFLYLRSIFSFFSPGQTRVITDEMEAIQALDFRTSNVCKAKCKKSFHLTGEKPSQ